MNNYTRLQYTTIEEHKSLLNCIKRKSALQPFSKLRRFRAFHAFGDFVLQLVHSATPSGSARGQRRPRSDCAGVQSDLGLRFPHMPIRHHLPRGGVIGNIRQNLNNA